MSKFSRYFKIFIFNIFIIILLFFVFEFFFAIKWGLRFDNINRYYNAVFEAIPAKEYFKALYNNELPSNTFSYKFRPDENVSSLKKPIIVMGCSFAWGDGLEKDETLSYLLSKETKRPVYNRSGRGWGLSQLLFQFREGFLFNQIQSEPEAVVYVFINEQVNRIDKYKIEPLFSELQPKYKYTKGKLVEEKPMFWDKTVIFQTYAYYYNYMFNNVLNEEIKQYFIEAKNEMNKKWKNTKFIIVLFPNCERDFGLLNADIWKKLQDDGFIVLNANNISGLKLQDNKYKITGDGFHPTKEVWQKFVPNFVKEVGL